MVKLLIIYVIVAFGLFFVPRKFVRYNPIVVAGLQLMAFVFFAVHFPAIKSNQAIVNSYDWISGLGLNFGFVLDGLSIVFAMLITIIGFLVFLYAKAYMKGYAATTTFYFYLTLFSGAMLGLVLSANFIQLFVFWELTSIFSFLLISFFNEKESARKAAFQSLFITAFGGLCLLSGFILLGSIVNSYSLTDWVNNAETIKASSKYLPSFILILLGVFTKSAQFPFHFWLPGAMQAPTPVSSYLHSATMVKAGVFLLMRLNPVLGGTQEWVVIIPLVGAITMLVGAYMAITQTDIKTILVYTTISSLGVLVLLLGIDTRLSVLAALVFLCVHAFYKASLFMMAGYIDKRTGTRDVDKLGALMYLMPLGFIVTSLALFSMAGFPPLLGFISKELIYEAKVQSSGFGFLILILGVFSNIFMVAVSLLFLTKVFLGKRKTYIRQPGFNQGLFLIGPGVLAIFSLGFGLFPNVLANLIEPALNVIRAEELQIKLNLWHGFNKVLLLSIITVILGVTLFYFINKYDRLLQKWRVLNSKIITIKLTDIFEISIERFIAISSKYTKYIQHGYHRYYLLTIFVFTCILLWVQVYLTRGWELSTSFALTPVYISGLVAVIAVSAVYSAVSMSRISTIVSMGVTGFGISLIYMYYSAIDLAITQVIVETLTIVMFVLVLQKLPKFAILSKRSTRIRDALIALSFGTVMTVLALMAINVDFNSPISGFYKENSLTQAFGKNIVNVILVDFRALDTLGEVTVLIVAAIGVFTLLSNKTESK
jgi:multicomponent Na+:H+ antiporter subunit A